MDPTILSEGFALFCDERGIIREVIRDDIGLEQLAPRQPIGQLVVPAERIKLLNFLAELRSKCAVFHWEMNLSNRGKVMTLHLSGCTIEDGLMIVGANTHANALKLLEEMVLISNEQVTTLRAQIKEQIQSAAFQNEPDLSIFDEITRLNNELVTLHRDLAKQNVELERLYTEVKSLSMTDPLTAVYNRRGFFTLGEQEIQRAIRYNCPLSALMFDLDGLKIINDRYGHAVGDQVIVETTQRVAGQLRKVDILGRHGGDEFTILLPETSPDEAQVIAERLLLTVSQPLIVKEIRLTVTISLGIAGLNASIKDLHTLLDHADQALYQSKARGKNQVFVS